MAKRQSNPKEDELFHEKELISKLLEFAAGYEIPDILRLVVDRVPHLIGARQASLFWLDRENNRIVLRETYIENRHKIGKHEYKIGEGLTGWVAKTGQPLRIRNITDVNELKSINPGLHWSDKHEGFRSASKEEQKYQKAFLAVPINIDGITMGVLRIAKTEKANAWFTRENEALLITFAGHLAAIIKNRELLERADDFKTLIEPMFFNSPAVMDQYFKYAANVIPTILNSRGCTIFLKDETIGAYVLRYTSRSNPLENEIGRAYYNEGEGLTGWVLRTGESLRVNDIQDEEELNRIHPALKWMGKYKEFL